MHAAVAPLLWLFVLVVFNLPQSLILWFEPDLEEPLREEPNES